MGKITTPDGVELAYLRTGRPGARTLCLLHALGESAQDWEPVLDRFSERYDVVAFDLRGHGRSGRPGAYSSRLMARDVAAALDALGLTAVTLLGHSLGGVVAFFLAMDEPQLVRRLVIEDVVPPYDRERPLPQRPAGVDLPFDWEVVPAIAAEAGRFDPAAWEGLGRIEAPTLVVAGGEESHIPQEKVTEAAERIPDCTVVTLPAGHSVHAARPGEFADAVLAWLDTRDSADSFTG